jgi:hypothetical protein
MLHGRFELHAHQPRGSGTTSLLLLLTYRSAVRADQQNDIGAFVSMRGYRYKHRA